jgi:hypothetical protein
LEANDLHRGPRPMANKSGDEKEMWDAINAARSTSPLGRLNHAELEAALADLAKLGWALTKTGLAS